MLCAGLMVRRRYSACEAGLVGVKSHVMPLRIALDASRSTASRLTGTEHYALRLIQALIRANQRRDPPHSFRLYFRDDPPASLFPSDVHTQQVVIPFPRAWTHLRFARELWKTRPDVAFVPAHSLPFLFPGRSIVTVHDLGYKHFPAAHPRTQRAYLDVTTRWSQARASVVLADSQATAADLGRFYGTPPAKIQVVYPGVDAAPLRKSWQNRAAVRAKYNLPARYFLFIGTLQPRKNIQGIVRAFARWQQAHQDENTALVLAGGKGWLFDEQWVQGIGSIKLIGYVDEADKGGLLGGALALVFPSLYEGFGFPVIEAMICGTPVIASHTSSLPELVGDAGLLVDPANTAEIAAAMSRFSENQSLRQAMIDQGYEQAKRFTWEQTAQRVMRVFDEIEAAM